MRTALIPASHTGTRGGASAATVDVSRLIAEKVVVPTCLPRPYYLLQPSSLSQSSLHADFCVVKITQRGVGDLAQW